MTNVPHHEPRKVLVQFTSVMQLEKVHPLQSGVLRLKQPSERRPGLPREGALTSIRTICGHCSSRNAQLARDDLVDR